MNNQITKDDALEKVEIPRFSSFRRYVLSSLDGEKPESCIFNELNTLWIPVAIYPHKCGDRDDDFLRMHQR
jgi:hypothetical protein